MIINIQSAGNIKKMKSSAWSAMARFFAVVMLAGALVCSASTLLIAADTATEKPVTEAVPVIITAITIEDNAVLVKVQGPINYTVYKPADPFLVTVEIVGASVGQFRDRIISRAKGITEVSPVQIEVPGLAARLDIMLQTKNEIRTEIREDVLVISVDRSAEQKVAVDKPRPAAAPEPVPTVKEGSTREIAELFTDRDGEKPSGGKAEAVKPKDEEPAETGPTTKDSVAKEITEMFFDRDKDVVELVIKADGKFAEPAVYQLDGTVILEIPAVTFRAPMPSKMMPPVKDIAVKSENGNLKIVITAQAGVQSEVYILDDELLVDFITSGARARKEVTEKGAAVQDKIVNGTKVISLDFQDADIVPILRLLGDVSGYNMVVHPDVKGKITMKLMNVPWTQALDIVIKTFNLEKVVEGNIIRVATVKAFQEEKKAMADNRELFGKAEEIQTRIFTVNNANVDTVKGKDGKPDMPGLKDLIEKGKILSPRGTISVDVRTRSIIVKDIPSGIDAVKRLLETLDKPTKQVLIEARIVEITTNYAQSLGVEWGMTGKAKGVAGSNRDSFTTQGTQGSSISGGQSSSSTLFNLPAALSSASPATSAITFGYLTADKTLGLDLRLSAIETRGKIRVVASPKILTLDNQEAIIKQGKKIPITTSQNSGGTITYTTTYVDATLKLTVTPQVSPDGAVVMKLELIRDEPNYTKVDVLGNPQIDTRLASTQVILNNGETVVIGGIINNNELKGENTVPGISKIPLIGELFRQNSTETTNFELLIFLTPKLMQ